MTETTRGRLLGAAVAAPAAVAMFALLLFSIFDAAGRTPLSYGPVRNLAEAAALGNAAEVARLLAEGGDPARVVAVRPEVISSSVARVSALEAAVWSRSEAMARLLDQPGAIADEGTRRHLVCLARDNGAGDVAEVFTAGAPVSCDAGVALQAVTNRR